jgi:hypothetical protein
VKFSVTLGAAGDGRDPAALAGLAHDRLAEFAAAGATWWGRWIPPGHSDETRKIIADGPPGQPDN